ncbi:hypothetical protein Clacol_002306 [Clathrus columnatus]|uniref:Mitochondrial import inner membrane translocase subunit TIM50 n=1 Tax=Clathrus columnatus TaxID=1419009 RepID=A0AAV5A616_9AGAM|nr:hypothetical protein Clacol_002306 [Clathrus columnatus]
MALPTLTPSASYLSLSNLISTRSLEPCRKLLILDLNGTLLYRSKYTKNRIIRARPYMATFCSYLFHENVRSWLDVMVWSSAQPRNVDIMVQTCFKESKKELKAVWARDTLGLDKRSYNHKVQTIKDLETPWKKLSCPVSHSANTTILMDDSPLKTQLQPYNHLCVREYTQNVMNSDRLARKRLRPSYDCMLLAAIGILEELKYQTNVAGWIRAGGLWADCSPPSNEITLEPSMDPEATSSGNASSQELLWFDHEPCYNYWVEKGMVTVKQLGINLNPGFS